MRKFLLTIGVAGLLLCAGQAARADEQSNDWEKQFQFRLEGLDKLMQGMDNLLQSIPRYRAPIIDENGDITQGYFNCRANLSFLGRSMELR